jgi:predicted metal-dependent peptidase
VLHPAMGHLWRRGERSPQKWNLASDLVVNQLLTDSGLQGPPEGMYLGTTISGVYFDPAWKQLSEEEIYQRLPDPPKQYLLCGDILAPSDGGQQQSASGQALADIWRDRLVQAAHAARQQDKLPIGLARLVEKLLHPSKDWRQVLAEFVQPTAWDYDWRRLDRRLLPDELYIPTLSGERIDDLVVAIDTSGSIGGNELDAFLSELRGILSAYPQVRATVLSCDAKVHQVWELDQDAPIPTQALGGGGTSFIPVFEKIAELGLQPSAVVFLTDGYGDYPDQEPSYPVLWVLTTDHRTPPWGRRTVLERV